MKRIISLIIAIILISFCLGIGSFASGAVTFSEDFTQMTVSGHSYSRINTSMLNLDPLESKELTVILSEEQSELVNYVNFNTDAYMDVVHVYISYKDGSTLSVTFINDSLLDEYNEIVNGTAKKYLVDFQYPYGNTVRAESADFSGEKITLGKTELEFCSHFPVYAQNDRGTLKAEKGSLIIYDDGFYYVDYKEAGITVTNDIPFASFRFSSLPVRRISNEKLCDLLKDAEQRYYDDDFGFLFNDEFTEKVSTVFIIFVMVILPLATLVVSLIFAIRSKGIYRKLSITVCSLSAASLIVVSVIYIIIQVYS